MNFQNKTILITGASRGIGEAAARHLFELGANLILLARSQDKLEALAKALDPSGERVEVVACDVADYDAVRAAVEKAECFGGVDIVVNNAGLIDPIARIGDSDPTAWSHMVDVNLKGPYYMMHAALPQMLAKKGGTFINISSGAAYGALEGWSHYCATKAGLLQLTRTLHKEYATQGIRSIGLSPGTVATQMQVEIKASGINPVSALDPSVHISPEWVAKAIAFLCGPAGDDYLGQDFSMKTEEGRAALGLPS
ncbi:SDR family oxidoreductase [Maritalea myrionectae]|uniref:SDR family oxidoreductase n=1 Tax=Maritalea myrionectae TaxID=454601 RepID=UPI0004259845|nr:SDR family oxidoreductase [Maritalea myrionectae]